MGFADIYINTGAGNLSAAKRVNQRLVIQDRTAGCVDQVGGWLHQRNHFSGDEAMGFGRMRTMKGNEVRLSHQFLQ